MRLLSSLLFLLVLISGCSLRPEIKPPITRYYLQPEIVPACMPQKSSKLLQLSFVDAIPSLLGKNIIYKKSDFKTGSYLYSKWDQSPRHGIMSSLYSALKEQQHYREIVYNTPIESDLTLEIKMMQFEQSFTENADSYAIVSIDALIYENQSRKLLGSRSFASKIKAETNDAQGGVKAINEALGKALSELVCWSAEQGGRE